jgi:hypothetical protein
MLQCCVSIRQDDHWNHQAHGEGCPAWPAIEEPRLLELHAYCNEALRSARTYFDHVEGVWLCMPQYHAELQMEDLAKGLL